MTLLQAVRRFRQATLRHWLLLALLCLAAANVARAQERAVIAYPEHQDLLYFLDAAGKRHEVKTVKDWETRRQHVLDNMQVVMGNVPGAARRVPLAVRQLEDAKVGSLVRRKLAYKTEPDTEVRAYLFLPPTAGKKVAAILCLHQTVNIGKSEPTGLGTSPNLQYALHLAQRGYVTLAPDYPSFGEYKYDFDPKRGYISGTMKAVWDNIRAVDLLQSLPQVDARRIGCIGHSLGGHNTMFTAAFDPRIKVMISNCGFTRFHKYYEGKLAGWTSDRYMPRIRTVYQNNPDKVPFDFTEIVASFAPRPFLASAPIGDSNFEVSGVKDCVKEAQKIYALYGKSDNLQANYPNCEHDFPENVRKVAYEFFDKHLEHVPVKH